MTQEHQTPALGISATSLPWRSTAMRCDTRSTSGSSDEMTMMALPWPDSCSMRL